MSERRWQLVLLELQWSVHLDSSFSPFSQVRTIQQLGACWRTQRTGPHGVMCDPTPQARAVSAQQRQQASEHSTRRSSDGRSSSRRQQRRGA